VKPRDELAAAAYRGEAPAGVRIVDFHAHLGPWGAFNNPHNGAEGIIEDMERLGIELTCLSAHAAIGPDFKRGNDEVAAACAQFPEKLAGACVVNPGYPGEVEAELERCFATGYFKLIKLHPALHGTDYDHPAYQQVYEFAADRGLAVLGHVFSAHEVASMRRQAERWPGANFVAGHSGAAAYEQAVQTAREVPNFYLETCLSAEPQGHLAYLVKNAGAEKVLFGTDNCFLEPAGMLGKVLWARISSEAKRRVLGLNALALLNLE